MTEPSAESSALAERLWWTLGSEGGDARGRAIADAARKIDALTEQRVEVVLQSKDRELARMRARYHAAIEEGMAAEQRVAAAVQAERERCAGILDEWKDPTDRTGITKRLALEIRKSADRPSPEGAAPRLMEGMRREELSDDHPLQTIPSVDLARPRCSTPSQEDTGPVSGPMVERVAAALDATPNLFLRVNKGRADSYPHEICWPGEPIVVIAAYRDHAEAVSRRGQLQLRAYASAAIAVMSLPPNVVRGSGSASSAESSPTPAAAPPGPTAGGVERALPWETLEADELREISDVERGERGADFVCVTRSAISDALTARGSAARAELLAQIREPTKAVVECVATKLERTFARSAYDKSIVVLRALADKLTEVK